MPKNDPQPGERYRNSQTGKTFILAGLSSRSVLVDLDTGVPWAYYWREDVFDGQGHQFVQVDALDREILQPPAPQRGQFWRYFNGNLYVVAEVQQRLCLLLVSPHACRWRDVISIGDDIFGGEAARFTFVPDVHLAETSLACLSQT